MSCLKLVWNTSRYDGLVKRLLSSLTCRPSALHRPLLVLVGAMVTTGGVLGTPWPLVWPRRDPTEPRFGVLTGELWLVAGEETGDDSPLRTEPEEGRDGE